MEARVSEIDLQVLRTLQGRSDLKRQKVLAHEIGRSVGDFSRRRTRLEKEGVIRQLNIALDRKKLGFHALAFFTVDCGGILGGNRIAKILAEDPAVQEIHYMAGAHPLLVKVIARTISDLSFWQEKVLQFEDVKSVRGQVAMDTEKETLNLPI